MKSGRIIDVSKSSLVSLKAELVKKQEEALKSKAGSSYIRPLPKVKKLPKTNPGVEERRLKDTLTQEDVDLIQKSKEVLEVKSKLYDKLQAGESVQDDVGDPYLVDFKEKLERVFNEAKKNDSVDPSQTETKQASDCDNDDDDDDDIWCDYTDCFGRSRRCLKEDFKEIKRKDDEMRKMLGDDPSDTNPDSEPINETPSEQQLEMISSDMQREKMREKWEKQEQILLNKKNIYYEDIRFDEARSHGVAYFSFSTDESKREEEQAEFKRLRDETAAKQREAQEARERRDLMKQSRLIAARQRQRARLGLPPVSVEEKETVSITKEEEPSNVEETNVKDLEAALSRAAHVRPWDVGKDGVKEPAKLLTQDEWIEKKRGERLEEFAPPTTEQYFEPPVKKGKKNKVNSSFRINTTDEDRRLKSQEPWPESTHSTSNLHASNEKTDFLSKTPKRGVAIPPPTVFDYYTPNKKSNNVMKKTGHSSKDMMESIEAGLEFLKKQTERRDKLVEKNKFGDS